jgi:hypothetical protein
MTIRITRVLRTTVALLGSSWTQPSYTPPPRPPSYTYRPPETYTRTIIRTPASPDIGHGAYHPSIVSPYTRTPSQTQPSSTSAGLSNVQYTSTRSHVPTRVPTEQDPFLSTVIHGVPRSDVPTISPCNGTPGQTQLPSTRIRPSCAFTSPSSTGIQLPSTPTHPFSTQTHPSSTRAQPSIRVVRFASTSSHVPSCVLTERKHLPPTAVSGIHDNVVSPHTRTQLSSTAAQPSPTPTKSSCQHSSKSARKKKCGGSAQAHNREAKAMKERNSTKIIFTENNKVCR